MPNCERNCGECGRCVGAHAQLVIDELNQKLESVTRCNCPSPCNAQGCLLKEIERLRAQVEKEHEVAGELQEGLSKQYLESATELDALDAKLKVANLQVREIREECAKIADNNKAKSEDAWGAGCTYAAVVIARQIRESGEAQAAGKCGHKLETSSEREALWDAKVSDLVCSIKACLVDGHVSEHGAKVLQAAVDRTPAESLMWRRGEVTEKRLDEKKLCGVWVREMGPCICEIPCKAHPRNCACPCHEAIRVLGYGSPCGVDECAPCEVRRS